MPKKRKYYRKFKTWLVDNLLYGDKTEWYLISGEELEKIVSIIYNDTRKILKEKNDNNK